MRLRSFVLVLAIGCARQPVVTTPTEPVSQPPQQVRAKAQEPDRRNTPPPAIPTGPGLVVLNDQSVDITVYAATLVDQRGDLGTLTLWPHRSDCPDIETPDHVIRRGLVPYFIEMPAQAYLPGGCEPRELPPGEYLLRLDSGYTEELYASAAITLPLKGPVELRYEQHDKLRKCDAALARRAAVLTFAAAKGEGILSPAMKRACRVDDARCGTLPLDEAMPPTTCTITLHERLLRVHMAAGDDAPRFLTAWADPEVVYVQRPEATRTSAGKVAIDGKTVVIAGETMHERHEHGGDAARIGSASFRAHNPLRRAVPLSVKKIEFLTNSQCGLPNEVRARPKLASLTPTKLGPGESEIEVAFAGQGAYQAHCDRFATRVTFDVGGKTLRATVEHEVMRFEPLRHER